MNPHRERFASINGYRVYLGRVVAYVKVDTMPARMPFSALSLQAGQGCYMVRRNLATSKDFDVMRETAVAAHRRQLLLKGDRVQRAPGVANE